MAQRKETEEKLGKMYYVYKGYTQLQISKELGVSTKAVNGWAKKGNWEEEKENIRKAPEIASLKLNEYLANIFKSIDDRDGVPTSKEADTISKIIAATSKLTLVPSQIFRVITDFMDFLQFRTELGEDEKTMLELAASYKKYMERVITEHES